jgi:hypothetical protein
MYRAMFMVVPHDLESKIRPELTVIIVTIII